jgi:hypothetical protein
MEPGEESQSQSHRQVALRILNSGAFIHDWLKLLYITPVWYIYHRTPADFPILLPTRNKTHTLLAFSITAEKPSPIPFLT